MAISLIGSVGSGHFVNQSKYRYLSAGTFRLHCANDGLMRHQPAVLQLWQFNYSMMLVP